MTKEVDGTAAPADDEFSIEEAEENFTGDQGGVSKHGGRYPSEICVDGVRFKLGSDEAPEAAARRYAFAAYFFFGAFARPDPTLPGFVFAQWKAALKRCGEWIDEDRDSAGRKIPPRYPASYSNWIDDIPIASIIVRDRQRGDDLEGRPDGFENGQTIAGLRASIDDLGFWGCVGVTKHGLTEDELKADKVRLVSGNRRQIAVSTGTIRGQIITPHPDDPNPELTLMRIEFNEDNARLQRDQFNIMFNREKIVTAEEAAGKKRYQIARERNIEDSTLSDSVNNARFARQYPEKVKHCQTEKEIRKVRKDFENARDQQNLEEMNRIPIIMTSCDLYEFHIRLPRLQYVDFTSDKQDAQQALLRLFSEATQDG